MHERLRADGQAPRIVHLTRGELAGRPVVEALTTRGKELTAGHNVAAARRLLSRPPVRVVPVLDGVRYVGAVDRACVDGVPEDAALGPLAAALLPTVTASTTLDEALGTLDRTGDSRLVVLGDDGRTYVGLVCLRGDRERLCVDAALHPTLREQGRSE